MVMVGILLYFREMLQHFSRLVRMVAVEFSKNRLRMSAGDVAIHL